MPGGARLQELRERILFMVAVDPRHGPGPPALLSPLTRSIPLCRPILINCRNGGIHSVAHSTPSELKAENARCYSIALRPHWSLNSSPPLDARLRKLKDNACAYVACKSNIYNYRLYHIGLKCKTNPMLRCRISRKLAMAGPPRASHRPNDRR